jgi:cell division protease FtsH
MIFLGREISEQRDYSEKVAEEIDDEVRHIIEQAHELARQLLRDNKDKLVLLAQKLIEVETLEGEQLITLLDGGTPPAAEEPATPPPSTPPPVEPETRPDEDQPRGQPRPGLAWGN